MSRSALLIEKNEPVSTFEQGCEQVSNLVNIIVYEEVHEWVSNHKCEQVSKSEQVSIIVWLIEKMRSEHIWTRRKGWESNRKFNQEWASQHKCVINKKTKEKSICEQGHEQVSKWANERTEQFMNEYMSE